LVVDQSVGAGLAYGLQAVLYARSVCDMNSAAAAAVCGLWHYTSVICIAFSLRCWSHDQQLAWVRISPIICQCQKNNDKPW